MNESASSRISGLNLTTENYDEAVKILEDWFGNTQILTSAFIQQFLSLPKIKSANDISGPRKLFNKEENSVRNLKTLSVEPDTYGSLLVPLNKWKIAKWSETFNCAPIQFWCVVIVKNVRIAQKGNWSKRNSNFDMCFLFSNSWSKLWREILPFSLSDPCRKIKIQKGSETMHFL